MGDPAEGLTAEGLITTGAARSRVPEWAEPALADTIATIGDRARSVHLYGSVATGQARRGASDLDIIAVGLDSRLLPILNRELSSRHGNRFRAIAVSSATLRGLAQVSVAGYGGRVFLRHYCVLVAGKPLPLRSAGYRGDRRAACGFNGDIDERLRHWHSMLRYRGSSLPRQIASKTLFALAGLVSIRDRTWTTDRLGAARRWGQLMPEDGDLTPLTRWLTETSTQPDWPEVTAVLNGQVTRITERFGTEIGFW